MRPLQSLFEKNVLLCGLFSLSLAFQSLAFDPKQEISILGATYRPPSGSDLGSLDNPDFRKKYAKFLWDAALNTPIKDSFAGLLSKKVFRADGSDHLIVVDPGAGAPSDGNAVSSSEMDLILNSKELAGQVSERLLPKGDWGDGRTLKDSLPREAVSVLGGDEELLELLAIWQTPEDFMPLVIKHLCDIRAVCPDPDWRHYKKLAVAIALVDDQMYPEASPHSQVDKSAIPRPAMTPVEKFTDMVSAHKKGELLLNPNEMAVGELFYLFGHTLSLEELKWARKNRPTSDATKLPRLAFDSIKYDSQRMDTGEFTWKAGPYTLGHILKIGGICIDQAYYTDSMCKASGVPSMVFVGIGDAGGHAWVGAKNRQGWNIEEGKSGGKYLLGRTYNPQNWAVESDQDFSSLTSSQSEMSRLGVSLADTFNRHGLEKQSTQALEAAARLSPHSTLIWQKMIGQIAKDAPVSDVLRELKKDLKQQDLAPGVRASIKREIAQKEKALGRKWAADRVEREIVKENLEERTDISAQQLTENVRRLMESGDVVKAAREHKNALKTMPPSAFGDFFYTTTRPMVEELVAGGKRAQAIAVFKAARESMSPPPNSLLDRDISALGKLAYRGK